MEAPLRTDDERQPLSGLEVVVVAPEDTLGEAAEKMLARRTGSALVVDYGPVIGVVTWLDLLRAAADRVHPSEARVREWMSPAKGELVPAREVDLAEQAHYCELAWEMSRIELCPQEVCTFWWKDGCLLAGLEVDIAADRQVADFLLGLRAARAA
jgi:CBS domain containing-hemolysin-like protein